MTPKIADRTEWGRQMLERSRRVNEERNAGKDDSNRCPSVHAMHGSCCQFNKGHDGPHIAEFQLPDGTIWPGKYLKWHHGFPARA